MMTNDDELEIPRACGLGIHVRMNKITEGTETLNYLNKENNRYNLTLINGITFPAFAAQ